MRYHSARLELPVTLCGLPVLPGIFECSMCVLPSVLRGGAFVTIDLLHPQVLLF